MTTTMKIREFAGLGEVTGKTRWRVRIIGPGRGASAIYPADVLEAFGPIAFPAGTKINIDHQSDSEEWDQPAGSLKWLAGALVTDAEWSEDPEPGLYATVELDPKWAEFVERYSEIIGLSIRANAHTDDEEDGLPVVTSFVPSPLNTVDIVTVPGANGRFIEALEHWYDTMANVNEISQEETDMDESKVREMIDTATVKIIEALTPAEPEVEEGAPISDVFSKVTGSGLTKTNQNAIISAYENDPTVDVDDLIAEKKEIEDSVRADLETDDSDGSFRESAGGFDGRTNKSERFNALADRTKNAMKGR